LINFHLDQSPFQQIVLMIFSNKISNLSLKLLLRLTQLIDKESY